MTAEFLSLAVENRLRVFNEIYLNTNINPIAVEKD